MTLRPFRIPPLAMLMTIILLAVGELICGTSLYFVAMMTITMASIGITYNLLGGLSTFSGIIFVGFALRTIVISQFAKVLLFEAADRNLEAPYLTISLYATFYFCVLIGTFLFGRVRIKIIQPAEPNTEEDAMSLYLCSLILGLVGTVIFQVYIQTYGKHFDFNARQSIGVALAPLLLLALVLAVDMRIRKSGGRHSFGLLAIIPSSIVFASGFVSTVRTEMALPLVVYCATCYVRGFRFRIRHYVALGLGSVVFSQIISPLAIYSRDMIRDQALVDKIYITYNIATTYNLGEISSAAAASFREGDPREQYFSRSGTFTLSRFSLIRADSTLISACSGGFHYGLAQVNEMISSNIPSFLDKNKSRAHENNYLAFVSGLGSTLDAQPAFSTVADSYGAFGWMGVILVPLLGFPAVFVLYESMFDVRRPWGTVALGMAGLLFGELTLDRFVVICIRYPLYILVFSRIIIVLLSLFAVGSKRTRISLAETTQQQGNLPTSRIS